MKTAEYYKMYKLEEKHFWFLGKRFFTDSVLAKHKRKIKRVLDIGCGTGGMTKYLQKYGVCLGLEKSPLAAGLAKKRGVKVVTGEAENLPFAENQFDLATLFDVLYHREINNPEKALSQANRVLKPGGLILVNDSAFNFLKSSHDKLLHGKRRFTLNQMKRMLKRNGFEVLKASYVYFSIFPAVFIRRLFLEKVLKWGDGSSDVREMNRFLNSIITFIIRFEAYLLRFISFPWGSSILVLGQKNEHK